MFSLFDLSFLIIASSICFILAKRHLLIRDSRAQTFLLCHQLTGKAPDAGEDCKQKEKRGAEIEMVRWHHRLHRHECEQTRR